MILTQSLRDCYEMNGFVLFDENNLEELRISFYLLRYQKALDEKKTPIIENIPFLSFNNYKESNICISFIKESNKIADIVKRNDKWVSEETFEKYKFFLRIHPLSSFFINRLFFKYFTRKSIKFLENLHNLYIEILAELLFYGDYQLFYLYLSHLQFSDPMNSYPLKNLFEILLNMLEEQEFYEVFYQKNQYQANSQIKSKLKNLANITDNTIFRIQKPGYAASKDEEICLVKGKIIEALMANGNKTLIKLFNDCEENSFGERNKKLALPSAFGKLKIMEDLLEKNS